MAAFSDVGAICSLSTCQRQDFLPTVCFACQQPFCKEHYRQEDHNCEAAKASPDPPEAPSPVRRCQICAAPNCREQLTVQNRLQCRTCGKAVCLRHRFEDQHPCVDLEASVKEALRLARDELRPDEYAEAHRTMLKVFGNVLENPKNEKFRTLRKANAAVQEKLRHPSCTQALLLCGFSDEGDSYVCQPSADLSTMRRVCAQLKASPPAAAGVRIVDGVIQRPSKADEQEATSAAAAKGYSSARPPPAPAAAATGAKPRSAFDFQRRGDREAREQAQTQDLQDLRKQQKERYKSGGSGAGATQSTTSAAPAGTPASDGCTLQ